MPFQCRCHTIVCERTSSVETFWLIYKITNNNVSTKDSPSYWRDGKAKWKIVFWHNPIEIGFDNKYLVDRFAGNCVPFSAEAFDSNGNDPDSWHVHIRIYHIILIRFLYAGRWVIRVYDLCCVWGMTNRKCVNAFARRRHNGVRCAVTDAAAHIKALSHPKDLLMNVWMPTEA